MARSIKLNDDTFIDVNNIEFNCNTNHLTNLNNLISGIGYYNESSLNKPNISTPSQYGVCFAFGNSIHSPTNAWIFQIAFDTFGHLYKRCKINNGEWNNWVLIVL